MAERSAMTAITPGSGCSESTYVIVGEPYLTTSSGTIGNQTKKNVGGNDAPARTSVTVDADKDSDDILIPALANACISPLSVPFNFGCKYPCSGADYFQGNATNTASTQEQGTSSTCLYLPSVEPDHCGASARPAAKVEHPFSNIVENPKFFSFGRWGYHTIAHDHQVMPGFSTVPPDADTLCGRYKIMFAAALQFNNATQKACILLRRPASGNLLITGCKRPVTIGVGGRLGSLRTADLVTGLTSFEGKLLLNGSCRTIDRFFGPGYKFFGFSPNTDASRSYTSKAANATLIVTKKHDNKGRLYVINRPKAFMPVELESGTLLDESSDLGSQEQEYMVSKNYFKRRHISFLCKRLGLPCAVSSIITSYVYANPCIFAEPGDIWIDIRLTTPVRTYVLARKIARG